MGQLRLLLSPRLSTEDPVLRSPHPALLSLLPTLLPLLLQSRRELLLSCGRRPRRPSLSGWWDTAWDLPLGWALVFLGCSTRTRSWAFSGPMPSQAGGTPPLLLSWAAESSSTPLPSLLLQRETKPSSRGNPSTSPPRPTLTPSSSQAPPSLASAGASSVSALAPE